MRLDQQIIEDENNTPASVAGQTDELQEYQVAAGGSVLSDVADKIGRFLLEECDESMTVAKLKAYRIWQAQIWLKSKKKFDYEAPLIFNGKTFGWIQKSVPQQRWRRFLNRIGVEYKSLHKLRHTFASIMGQNGAPPQLMRDTLGHSDTRTTLETYTHVFEDKKKEQQLQYMHRG